MEQRYITVGEDLAGTPICYRDEQGLPVTFATREEAAAEIADDTEEFHQQVKDGERDPDDLPEPDDIYACTVNADGSVTLEDGTVIPATQD